MYRKICFFFVAVVCVLLFSGTEFKKDKNYFFFHTQWDFIWSWPLSILPPSNFPWKLGIFLILLLLLLLLFLIFKNEIMNKNPHFPSLCPLQLLFRKLSIVCAPPSLIVSLYYMVTLILFFFLLFAGSVNVLFLYPLIRIISSFSVSLSLSISLVLFIVFFLLNY